MENDKFCVVKMNVLFPPISFLFKLFSLSINFLQTGRWYMQNKALYRKMNIEIVYCSENGAERDMVK